jgi:hypothetical protein
MAPRTKPRNEAVARVGWTLGLGVLLIVADSVVGRVFGASLDLGFPGFHLWMLGALVLLLGVVWAFSILLRHP